MSQNQDVIEKKATEDKAVAPAPIELPTEPVEIITEQPAEETPKPEPTPVEPEKAEQEMIIHFNTVIDKLLAHEGGYVNDPKDPGGETNFGISKKSFPNTDIAALTIEDAKQIYFDRYWKANNIDLLPQHLRYIVFDTAVNMGGRTAVIMLQKLVGVSQDGRIGPVTAKAAQNLPIKAYANARMMRYHYLIARNSNLKKFIRGWTRRVNEVVQFTRTHYISTSN